MLENLHINQFWQQKYRDDSQKSWNLFYKRNSDKFFKDRHWTTKEFPFLLHTQNLLEIGCGVGNFIFPLLDMNRTLQAWVCDFSENAISLVVNRKIKSGIDRCFPFITDITKRGCFEDNIRGSNLDIVTCFFVLSAIPPEYLAIAIENMYNVMTSGKTRLLIRDYSKGDAAEKRFKSDRQLGPSLFVRQDGTLSNFFELSVLTRKLMEAGFEIESAELKVSRTSNILTDLDEERYFVQIVAHK